MWAAITIDNHAAAVFGFKCFEAFLVQIVQLSLSFRKHVNIPACHSVEPAECGGAAQLDQSTHELLCLCAPTPAHLDAKDMQGDVGAAVTTDTLQAMQHIHVAITRGSRMRLVASKGRPGHKNQTSPTERVAVAVVLCSAPPAPSHLQDVPHLGARRPRRGRIGQRGPLRWEWPCMAGLAPGLSMLHGLAEARHVAIHIVIQEGVRQFPLRPCFGSASGTRC